MRTVVNINAGGRTRLSGVTHSIVLLGIILELGHFAAFIPLSVLAGVLLTVGIGIIDYRGLKHLKHVPKSEAAILVIVLLLTVFGNLLHAVGVGVVLACVLFMKQVSDVTEGRTSLKALASFKDEEPWEDEGSIYNEYQNNIYIKHLYGPLFFGFTSRFQELIKSLHKDVKVLIIRMERVPYIDQTGIYAMEDSISSLQNNDVVVILTGLQAQPLDMLKKIDIIPALVPDIHLFKNFKDCESWLKENLKDKKDGLKNILKELRRVKKTYLNYRI
jgi:SulP family sulfate permease